MPRPEVNKVFVDCLVKRSLLSQEQLDEYIAKASQSQLRLNQYLIQNNILTDEVITEAISKQLGLKVVQLNSLNVEQDVISKVPVKFASFYRIVPISLDGSMLTIATAMPLELRIQDELRVHLGVQPRIVLTQFSQIEEALKKFYGVASDTIDRILSQSSKAPKAFQQLEEEQMQDLDDSSSDPSVTRLVNQIILEAHQQRATDIHIEPYRKKVRFRYRVDGVLIDANLPQEAKHFLLPILSRIKIMANLSIIEKRLPQDGSAVVKIKNQQLDLRVSTIPTPRGESMVIRVLPSSASLLDLEKISFDPSNPALLRDLLTIPHGVIFVTGPTGSGKTTTLYTSLSEINSPDHKIITIEDPIEYEMEGVTQIQINPKIGFGFAEGLKSVLRHDPDILMVGEVRDRETAEIAIRTALTGHLVFSTLHTNDAASGVTRLIDMGIEPYLVASSVEAFVAQRLIRQICQHCKAIDESPLDDVRYEIRQSLGLSNDEEIVIHKGAGCDKCHQTGFYGRGAIFEVLKMTEEIQSIISDQTRSETIKEIAVKNGMRTLRQDGWHAVLAGLTTPSEVMNVTSREQFIIESQRQDNPSPADTPKDEPAAPSTGGSLKGFSPTVKEKTESFLSSPSSLFKTRIYEFRAYPRLEQSHEFTYEIHQETGDTDNQYEAVDGCGEGRLCDISAGGFQFVTKDTLQVGYLLDSNINFDDNQEPLKCYSKVCRVEQNSLEGLYTVSVFYLDIQDEDRMRLDSYIRDQLALTSG